MTPEADSLRAFNGTEVTFRGRQGVFYSDEHRPYVLTNDASLDGLRPVGFRDGYNLPYDMLYSWALIGLEVEEIYKNQLKRSKKRSPFSIL